jgi:transposase
MAIKPNPENATTKELEIAKESTPDKQQYIRLSVIQRLLEGHNRGEVARDFNRNINTITTWVKQWNEGGIDALRSVKKAGRPMKLTKEQTVDINDLLLHPELVDETHWTLVKLKGYLKEIWQQPLAYSTLRDYVLRLGFSRVIPRPWAEGQDLEQRKAFIEILGETMGDTNNEVWFGDETGVVGDPRPRHRWAITGSHPRVPFTGAHIRQSVIGAVQPGSGETEVLIVPNVDSEIFQLFLDQLSNATNGRGKQIILVLDNASWHKAKRLDWHNITPMYLPPYSPDLNPIERLWARVKANFFADWFAKSHEELTLRLVDALSYFINNKEKVSKTCSVA